MEPIPLWLFDGSSTSSVSSKTWMLFTMPTGETHEVEFFVTKLDKGYSVVLGYNWLVQHNLAIDWIKTKVIFRKPPVFLKINTLEKINKPEPKKINICQVSAKNLKKLSWEPGATMFFILKLSDSPSSNYSIKPIDLRSAELGIDTLTLLPEYQEFSDMFSGKKANMLPPHQPYDLQINTEGDVKPFYGPIYSLSPPELAALQEFLDENTQNVFIQPSRSPWGSPVLFIKKKDGSLQLCVDYWALNKVTQKDWYPLPLISDLLDSPGPARIYTKINLKHAYHLVQITDGNESKMAFQTCYCSFEWMVMPFGLSNAPAAFQHFINEVQVTSEMFAPSDT